MSVIRIESIYDEQRVAKSGKKYGVTVVTGTRYGTDEKWEQPIFSNNKKILQQLAEFGKGDVANFKYEENGKFHDLVTIEVPSKELISKIDTGEVSTASKGGGGGKRSSNVSNTGSDKMSKGEWAEKDRLTIIRIAKAVALKAAVDNTKLGITPSALISMAEELIPWLMDTSITSNIDTGEDALSPPIED